MARDMAKKKMSAVEREFARLAAALAQRDPPETTSRRERGLRKLTGSVGVEGGQVLNKLIKSSPELTRYIVDFAYGDVIARDRLDDRTRALVVVAALAAMGDTQPELHTHVGTALNAGCTQEEIMEVILIVAVYAGFPRALNAMATARAAFDVNKAEKSRAGKRGEKNKPDRPT